MTGQPLRVLLPCDHAPVPAELEAQAWDRRQPLTAAGDAAEINLEIESLFGKVCGQIDGRAADLIRIATFCYVADQFITRGGSADVHRDDWGRRLTLCIGVTDPTFWSSPAVVEALGAALAFATDDEWSFAFSQAPAKIGISQLSLDLDDHVLLGQPDSVLLFSGGTDSLCALVDAVVQGKRPVVVCHTPAKHITARIGDLLDEVRHHFTPGWQVPKLTFDIHRKGKEPESRSQRTRAFLYAALGAATALQLGLTEVTLADNGYVSQNPPISGQIVGAIASRGTHPTFLRLMNTFFARGFAQTLTVENPLSTRTRAEALQSLRRHGEPDWLRLTHSCGSGPHEDGHPHCGYCSQCVDRRFAVIAAGLQEADAQTPYKLDVFTDSLPTGEPRQVALSYVSFARSRFGKDEEAILRCEDELIEQSVDSGPGSVRHMLTHAGVLRRHSDEVMAALEQVITDQRQALASGTLPDDGLLRLILGGGTLPESAETIDATPDIGVESPAAAREAPDVPDDTPHPHIERRGTIFYLQWQGIEEGYSKKKGFVQLAYLLNQPTRPIWAVHLKRLGDGIPAETVFSASVSPEEAEDHGIHAEAQRTPQPMIDRPTYKQLKQRKTELTEHLAVARARGDHLAALDIEGRRAKIDKYLRSTTNIHDQIRPDAADDAEKARKAVSKKLHAAIADIAKLQRDLANHLLDAIDFSVHCAYSPKQPVRWLVKL